MGIGVAFIISLLILVTRKKMFYSMWYDLSCTCTFDTFFIVRVLNANKEIVVNKVIITTVKKVGNV